MELEDGGWQMLASVMALVESAGVVFSVSS